MAKFVLSERDISSEDFERFKKFLQESCGVILGDNKRYLVINRLERLIGEFGISTFDQLLDQVCSDRNRALRLAVIDAMTTHETFWFRDTHPFRELEQILKRFANERKTTGGEIRIWSAACSTGQEPYSIAMIADQLMQSYALNGVRVRVIATDISENVVAHAQRGIYPNIAVSRGLNDNVVSKYFTKNAQGDWVISPRIREYVSFRPLNLIDSFAGIGSFDVVFIRNVLIYFSKDMKSNILERIGQVLRPGGYLFLGSSESFQIQGDTFLMERYPPQGIVYRKKR